MNRRYSREQWLSPIWRPCQPDHFSSWFSSCTALYHPRISRWAPKYWSHGIDPTPWSQHLHIENIRYLNFHWIISTSISTIPISCCSVNENMNPNLAFFGGSTCDVGIFLAIEQFIKMKTNTKHRNIFQMKRKQITVSQHFAQNNWWKISKLNF